MPSSSYIQQRLRKLGLSDAVAAHTATLVKVQSLDAGRKIWAKGGEVSHWHYLISGLVSASISTTNSESTPLSIYGKGAWFGEQSIINRKPSFARYVAKLMAWRVQKTSETLTLMKLGNPCLRVVMGLAQFAEALAYKSDRPPTIGFGEGVEIPIAQTTLASLCGVSRTLFSEYVQQLAQNGWLKISYGKLEILNIGTWHAFARSQREDSVAHLNASIGELLQVLRDLEVA